MEVLSSRVLYRSSNFDTLRQFYEQTVGLHVYREYGASERVLGVVFFLGGGFLEITRASTSSPSVTLWVRCEMSEPRRTAYAPQGSRS